MQTATRLYNAEPSEMAGQGGKQLPPNSGKSLLKHAERKYAWTRAGSRARTGRNDDRRDRGG